MASAPSRFPAALEPIVDVAAEEVGPVGLPDPFDHALATAGLLIAGSLLLPAAAEEGQGVRLLELLDRTWGPLGLGAVACAGLALVLLALGPIELRRVRGGLALSALLGAVLVLEANSDVANTLLPGPLALLGRTGLASAVGGSSLAALLLARLSRRGDGREHGALALLSFLCTVLVVTPVTIVLAAGARTAAASHADVHAALGLRAAALVLATTLTAAAALDALLRPRRAGGERGSRTPVVTGGLLALLAPGLAGGYLAGAALAGPRPLDPEHPAPWMAALYGEALPELAETIARAARGEAGLEDIERALDRTSSLASSEPKLRRAVEALGETLRWGVPSTSALAHAEDRLNRTAESLGVPFFVDVQLGKLDPERPLRERAFVLTYRATRVRTTRTAGTVVRTWWLERADHTSLVEQRLGWTRAGRAECSIILDVVRRRVADELEHRRAEEAMSTAEDEADAAELLEALTANVEAHEIEHAVDRDHLEPPRVLRRQMTYHSEGAIASASAELASFLAELGRGRAPELAVVDMAAFAQRFPDSAEGEAARVAAQALAGVEGDEGEAAAEATGALGDLSRAELQARARAAYRALFGRELPETVVLADRRIDRTVETVDRTPHM